MVMQNLEKMSGRKPFKGFIFTGEKMHKALSDMKRGERATVKECPAGYMLKGRLESMGVREGKTLEMISSQLMGGPIIIEIDGRHIAIGKGMAKRITVSVINSKE